MKTLRVGALSLLMLSSIFETAAFVPASSKLAPPSLIVTRERLVQVNLEPKEEIDVFDPVLGSKSSIPSWSLAALPAFTTLFLSLPAEASAGGAPFPSAVAAYVHYASLLVITGCIAVERITVKAGMSQEDQDLITGADIGLGISGTTLAVSGYYRVVDYGKGWDFYSHEPVFWLKIALVGVFGALSFFPTTKIIQRSLEKNKTGSYPEMSEKLASRMQTILNAEITAILSIPLSATIMSRGIGYNDSIPWQAEAFLSAAVFIGLGYKYVKEALDFEEDEVLAPASEE